MCVLRICGGAGGSAYSHLSALPITDNKYVLSGSDDTNIRLWKARVTLSFFSVIHAVL
jgi:WD40 repeat protein